MENFSVEMEYYSQYDFRLMHRVICPFNPQSFRYGIVKTLIDTQTWEMGLYSLVDLMPYPTPTHAEHPTPNPVIIYSSFGIYAWSALKVPQCFG